MGTPVVALCGKVWVPSRDPAAVPGLPGVQGDLGRPAGDGKGGGKGATARADGKGGDGQGGRPDLRQQNEP